MEESKMNILPMAVGKSKNEMTITFEFKVESDENIFIVMKRQADENFGTFLSRLEKNIYKRVEQDVSFICELETNDGIFIEHQSMLQLKICDVFKAHYILLFSGQQYRVQYNSPRVTKFNFPPRIFVNHFILPKISFEDAVFEDSKFSWFAREYNFKTKVASSPWRSLKCNQYAYKISNDDVRHQFKIVIEPYRETLNGVRSIHYTTNYPEILDYDFNYIERSRFTKAVTSTNEFRVVCYNLLAEMYTDNKESREMFEYCSKEYLDYSYRKAVQMNEILSYNGDIYLFQEVDTSFYRTLALSMKGYKSKYAPKREMREGCAIFYNENKFKFVDFYKYNICDLFLYNKIYDPLRTIVRKDAELYDRLTTLPNGLMVLVLEELSTKLKWIVANTHLFAGATADTIRFLQTFFCFQHLRALKPTIDNSYLLFGGDFNSTPDTNVIRILNETVQLSDFPEYSEAEYEFEFPLKLKSACGFPEYTNYTVDFIGCLDYIFYDSNKLEVQNIVPFPDHEKVIEEAAIPSKKFPSDHIPLICTLKYK